LIAINVKFSQRITATAVGVFFGTSALALLVRNPTALAGIVQFFSGMVTIGGVFTLFVARSQLFGALARLSRRRD
jgi:hypothetical protein